MNFKRIALLAAALCATASFVARGQAIATASGPGLYPSVGGSVSAFQVDYGKRVDYGYSVFADFHLRGRFGLEAEYRTLRFHTDEGVTQTTYLVGPTAYIIKRGAFRPYAKFLVGDAQMRFPFGYANGSYFVIAPGTGLDLHVLPNIDLRVIDVEYQEWPQFTCGPQLSCGKLNPYGISAGIKIRLTRPNIFRKDPYVYD
jgi:hypothetical protein